MATTAHEIVDLEGRPAWVVRWTADRYGATADVWSAVVTSYPGGTQQVEAWDEDEPRPPAEARSPAIRVSFKWDGCSNWDFSPDGTQLHLCGPADARSVAALMAHLYQGAAARIGAAGGEWHGGA